MKPRPSIFSLAKLCPRAPWLAARYPEQTAYASEGLSVDAAVSAAIRSGAATTREAERLCLDWLEQTFPTRVSTSVQRTLALTDPETGATLVAGTPDLFFQVDASPLIGLTVHVVDWKKNEQRLAGKLPPIDDDWQLKIYLAMAWQECPVAVRGQYHRVCWSDSCVFPESSQVYQQVDLWGTIDTVKAAPEVDPEAPKPTACKGEHCGRCYQRHHCDAYLLPAGESTPAALVPLTIPAMLAPEEATGALAWLAKAEATLKAGKALMEIVEAALRSYVDRCGAITLDGRSWGAKTNPGRRSGPTVKELEDNGLYHLIRDGKPSTTYGWLKK